MSDSVHSQVQGLVCVAIAADAEAGDPQAEVLAAARQAEPAADVIEIRLDSIPQPEITPFVKEISRPLLFTNRAQWEGGLYQGDEGARTGLLLDAINAGAAYVDIEMMTAFDLRQEVIDRAAEQQTQVIVSWHNFDETPAAEKLEEVFSEQYACGAQIGKIVTMAKTFEDVLRVLALQLLAAEKDFPLIAFCMGRAGMISRLATLELGGYMTYAAPDSGKATAPGQLQVSTLRTLLQTLEAAAE
jgi:3-dehydroquinate dehydratase-1/3-dehydroquinate dehydratase/shikimate dehydrogenase